MKVHYLNFNEKEVVKIFINVCKYQADMLCFMNVK